MKKMMKKIIKTSHRTPGDDPDTTPDTPDTLPKCVPEIENGHFQVVSGVPGLRGLLILLIAEHENPDTPTTQRFTPRCRNNT